MSKCFNNSYVKWWLGIDIRDILLLNTEIAEMTSEDIYPLIAPEGTQGNFILYHRIKYNREYSKMGLYEDIARVEILAITESYEDGMELAALIDATLTGEHTNDMGNTLSFSLYDSYESFEDNKYVQTLIFEVK